MELAERLQLPMFGIGACLSLATASKKQGDLATALRHHRRHHEFYVKLASNKAQAHARAIAVKFETEKAQAVAEAQRLRAELLGQHWRGPSRRSLGGIGAGCPARPGRHRDPPMQSHASADG